MGAAHRLSIAEHTGAAVRMINSSEGKMRRGMPFCAKKLVDWVIQTGSGCEHPQYFVPKRSLLIGQEWREQLQQLKEHYEQAFVPIIMEFVAIKYFGLLSCFVYVVHDPKVVFPFDACTMQPQEKQDPSEA